MTRPLALPLLVILVSSCAITQTAKPVRGVRGSGAEICVAHKADVRQVFETKLLLALEARGLAPRVLPASAQPTACPLFLRYNARWSWDFVPYMAWATAFVYRDGEVVGDALYSAPRAGWALTFRIYESTESKVDTMVDQLFPEG